MEHNGDDDIISVEDEDDVDDDCVPNTEVKKQKRENEKIGAKRKNDWPMKSTIDN